MVKAQTAPNEKNGIARREFLGQAGAAAAVAAGALVTPSSALAHPSGSHGLESFADSDEASRSRVEESFESKLAAATREARIPIPPHTANGDEERYPDKSGTYTKTLLPGWLWKGQPRGVPDLQESAEKWKARRF